MASLVAQAAPFPARRLRLSCAGEPAELGTRVLRSAALAGVLNAVLDEHVNLVNATARAEERGLEIEEGRRPRERGIADVLEIATYSAGDGKRREFSALGTILYGTTPRVLQINGIACEAPLEGNLLVMTNRDVPGVIGQVGTLLGSQGLNIASFALGRREASLGAEALAIVQLDGEVSESILPLLRAIPNVMEARIVRLPLAAPVVTSAAS
jgi:D-3-phosphoglycerate dehydrogenase